MKVTQKRISLPKSGEATLFIFGDIQEHSEGFSNEIFEEFKRDFKSIKNAYAIGLGDYGDFLRPSLRNRVAAAFGDDTDSRSELDRIIELDVERLAKKLDFLKGKLIGLHSGHHEWEYRTGGTSTQQLCKILGAEFLSWTAYTLLRISSINEDKKSYGSSVSVKIYSTHGSGGGSFNSTDLGNLEKKIAPYWFADLYLRGHSSKGELAPLEHNDVTTGKSKDGLPRLVKRTRWIVNCPGMMNGYVLGNKPLYVESMNMPPASLGYAKCTLKYGNFAGIDNKRITGVKLQPMVVSPFIYEN